MKLFNLFKKNECKEYTEQMFVKEPVLIEKEEELVAVKAKENFTLAKEYRKVKANDVFELTKARAEELEKKGLIKIL